MSVEQFGWEPLLLTDAPPACRLERALLTSYDRPDPRFLVEHLLPVLLRLDRTSDAEGIERQYFFGELARRLEALHGELVVVSSTSQTEELEADYPWLWRFVRPLAVGSEAKAVQHAKLWMLHWATSDGTQEYLELVISSANLTMSAFKGQIQGAWRACLPLTRRGTVARRAGWGILPAFLHELAASCGDHQVFAPFVELLSRAECPDQTHFVASVPGSHSRHVLRKTPWGAAGLAAVTPAGKGRVVASVLAPYVGSWTPEGLGQWCSAFGGKPTDLELIWIDRDHLWARGKHWVLPEKSRVALEEAGCQILELRHEPGANDEEVPRFHDEHRDSDDRWSHAKAYWFRRGRSHRMLITSANFSSAAWGHADPQGGLTIENFELGVWTHAEPGPFASLDVFDDFDRMATVAAPPPRSSPLLGWAIASWDGTHVRVECRVADAKLSVAGEVRADDRREVLKRWVQRPAMRLSSVVPWPEAKQPPEVAHLTCGDEVLEVPVFDARERAQRQTTPVPEVDEDHAEAMRDELLFEEYGGGAASEDGIPNGAAGQVDDPDSADRAPELSEDEPDVDDSDEDVTARSESYAIATFEQARISLDIVDTWATCLARVGERSAVGREARHVEDDGVALLAAFERQATRFAAKNAALAIGPRLAAEELRLRLKHHRDNS